MATSSIQYDDLMGVPDVDFRKAPVALKKEVLVVQSAPEVPSPGEEDDEEGDTPVPESTAP